MGADSMKHTAVKLANYAILLCLIILGVTFFQKGKLPDHTEIDPALFQEPVQEETGKEAFSVNFEDITYDVEPVAEYEMWGVVASETEYENSVSFKDIIIAWGETNLTSNDIQDVEFKRTGWRFKKGLQVDAKAMSRNHILAEDEGVRRQINNLQVGDQIHAKGMLVNYSPALMPSYKAITSTTREDDGNGACENVFVEDIEVIKRGTPLMFALFNLSWKAIIALIIMKIILFFSFFWEGKKGVGHASIA